MTHEPAIFVQPSPLHARTAPLCLTNAWVQDTRLTLVDVYRSLDEEYWALREGVGLFDASAFFAYRLSGRDAVIAANHIFTGDMTRLPVDSVMQTLWCDDFGHVIGLGRVLNLGDGGLEVQTRARSLAWFEDSAAGLDCRVVETTGEMAALGLVGPLASAVLERAGYAPAEPLGQGQSGLWAVRGVSVRVMHLGACGSPAYRLLVDSGDALPVWDRLMAAGAFLGLKPIGTAARDLARLEAGLPRLGVDFLSALEVVPWTVAATPEALGLDSLVDSSKTVFVGSRALRAAKEPTHRLLKLVVDGEGPYGPAFILSGQKPVGFVTSGAWSPVLNAGVIFAWVESEAVEAGGSLRLVSPPRLGAVPAPNGLVVRTRDNRAISQALEGAAVGTSGPQIG